MRNRLIIFQVFLLSHTNPIDQTLFKHPVKYEALDSYYFEPKEFIGEKELRNRLTPWQYNVTQLSYCDPPHTQPNTYCEEKGQYNCIVCNEHQFNSEHKIDEYGWPTFNTSKEAVKEVFFQYPNSFFHPKLDDRNYRVEAWCENCGAGLGQVYYSLKHTTGKEYLIYSSALKFIKDLNEE